MELQKKNEKTVAFRRKSQEHDYANSAESANKGKTDVLCLNASFLPIFLMLAKISANKYTKA